MRNAWWVAGTVLVVWLVLFRDSLFFSEVLALRDAGNFYYPLFQWQCAEFADGRFPLWNDLDGLGVPSVGDGTSSVFYPGKLIFALPIPFDLRFNLYLSLHVLVAAWSLYAVARRWGTGEIGSGAGALGYAFGGYVLSQHANVVFLISAAWLPWALYWADAMLARRSWRAALAFAAMLALMVYGGDPQTAYHAGLLAAVAAIVRALPRRVENGDEVRDGRWFTAPLALLTLAAAASFAFSALQVIPGWQWARQSDRAVSSSPRSLYELAFRRQAIVDDTSHAAPHGAPFVARGPQPDSSWRALIATPPVGTAARQAYLYSVGPWRLAEFVWPNFAGQSWPLNHRWLSRLPAEGRVWMPTLYGGLIPFLAALVAAWHGRRATRSQWLLVCAVIGITCSFGWYGIGWLIDELQWWISGDIGEGSLVGQPVGGPYWFLRMVLPGYTYFRFPAKWFVVAAASLSLLAAQGFDRLLAGDRVARRVTGTAAVVSGCLAILILFLRSPFLDGLADSPPDRLYGPLLAHGAWRDLFLGLMTSGLLAAGLWCSSRVREMRWAPGSWVWLVLTAIELGWAHQGLVPTVPGEVMHRTPDAVAMIRTGSPAAPPRLLHDWPIPVPKSWSQSADTRRLSEIVAWERAHLLHRHHLPFRIAALDAAMTVRPADWAAAVATLRVAAHEVPPPEFVGQPWALAYLLTAEGVRLHDPHASRARLVHEREPVAFADLTPSPGAVELVEYTPQRVVVRADLPHDGLLVLADAYHPDWVASSESPIAWRRVRRPIVRVEGYVRGVPLPAGVHHVTFEYRPWTLVWGLVVALGSGALALVLALRRERS